MTTSNTTRPDHRGHVVGHHFQAAPAALRGGWGAVTRMSRVRNTTRPKTGMFRWGGTPARVIKRPATSSTTMDPWSVRPKPPGRGPPPGGPESPGPPLQAVTQGPVRAGVIPQRQGGQGAPGAGHEGERSRPRPRWPGPGSVCSDHGFSPPTAYTPLLEIYGFTPL